MLERLQKIIARAGVASRRHAEELIQSGQVRVNGEVVTQLGSKADPAVDKVEVAGKLVGSEQEHVYLILHKPPEVVSSLTDPEGRKTLRNFLRGYPDRVYPVGSLDYASSGLIFLTNDGDLTAKLLKGWDTIPQVYFIKVKGRLTLEDLDRYGRETKTSMRVVRQPDSTRGHAANFWYEVESDGPKLDGLRDLLMHEGHPVEKVKRIGLSTLSVEGVPQGRYRLLEKKEVEELLNPPVRKKLFRPEPPAEEEELQMASAPAWKQNKFAKFQRPERQERRFEGPPRFQKREGFGKPNRFERPERFERGAQFGGRDQQGRGKRPFQKPGQGWQRMDDHEEGRAPFKPPRPPFGEEGAQPEAGKTARFFREFGEGKREGFRAGPPPRQEGFRENRPPRREEFGEERPPRRPFGDDRPRREFSGGRPPRKPFGGGKPRRDFGGEGRPPRREFTGEGRPPRQGFSGPGKPFKREGFSQDRPPRREFSGEGRPPRRDDFRGGRPPRKEFSGERPPRKPFGVGKPRKDFGGEGRPPRREFSGEGRPPRREFSGGKPPRKSFGGGKPYGKGKPRRDGRPPGKPRFPR